MNTIIEFLAIRLSSGYGTVGREINVDNNEEESYRDQDRFITLLLLLSSCRRVMSMKHEILAKDIRYGTVPYWLLASSP